MKGIMRDFLLFVVGIFVILIILSTVFGKGIAYNILGFVSQAEPYYLQEELRNLLTSVSYAPGEVVSKVKMYYKHNISISETNGYPAILVETSRKFKFSETPLKPAAFLTNCEIIKECTKTCKLIGERCFDDKECCGESCINGKCESKRCGNGFINRDLGEECDPPAPISGQCGGLSCLDNCICPDTVECNDGFDNDGDVLTDLADPDCTGLSDDSESGKIETPCKTESDCYDVLSCIAMVMIDKVDSWFVIKKFYENNVCKIKIERG